ncbi:MAG: hypothetical protein CMJ19_11350 [Phycisphaeraceae bacterium]|nr:hypothetical protein [Phycisphaeraceae bacterium]
MFNNFFNLFISILLLSIFPNVSFGWVKFYEDQHRIEAKPDQSQAVVEYRFANKGPKTVKITSIDTSCGCTVADLDKRIYEPGERGRIKVTFDFGDRSGWQQKTITVKTDDPQTPVKVLKLNVNIPRIAFLSPKKLRWDKDAQLRILKFSTKADLGIQVVEISYDDNAFQIAQIPSENKSEHLWAVVPKSFDKSIESAIRIKTNFPIDAPKEYTVQVTIDKKQETEPKEPQNKPEKTPPDKDTANAEPEKPHKMPEPGTEAYWMHMVFTGSQELPIRLEKPIIMLSPFASPQEQYLAGMFQTQEPITIDKVEIAGIDTCKAKVVPIDLKGYFLIKLTMDEPSPQTVDQTTASEQTVEDQDSSDDNKTPDDKTDKKKASQSKSKRGEILIYTTPPANTQHPVYGFIHQPIINMPKRSTHPKRPQDRLRSPHMISPSPSQSEKEIKN